MKLKFAKPLGRAFTPRNKLRREEPLTEGQAARLTQLLAAAKEMGAQKPAPPKPVIQKPKQSKPVDIASLITEGAEQFARELGRGTTRRLVAPSPTIWRSSFDGRIVQPNSKG